MDQLYSLRPILHEDKTKSLSLGQKDHKPLKFFLKNDALNFHLDNIVKTYVLVDQTNRVWAYISLMCSQLKLEEDQRVKKGTNFNRYEIYPAIKIVRLAVDQALQGQGYGSKLITFAIATSKDLIMPHIGCRFLMVDSKNGAIPFYEKIGFKLLDSEENKSKEHPILFMDLHPVL